MHKPVTLTEKDTLLSGLCRGKDVLNLGCVNHTLEAVQRPNWQHGKLAEVAKSILGLDYEKEAVDSLSRQGYNVRYADAQNFDLREEFPKGFQVIVASEIIEHLNNPGNFLDCSRKHLADDGILILTTPHAYGVAFFMEILIFGEEKINDDHTMTFSRKNLTHLLKRNQLDVVDFFWLTQDTSTIHVHKTMGLNILAKLFFWIQLLFIHVLNRGFSKEMVFICKKSAAIGERE
jgi:2-polyprenyl-3-methyl-5-hydroxy-6-metoxy-1,4-benzoquinol methylase